MEQPLFERVDDPPRLNYPDELGGSMTEAVLAQSCGITPIWSRVPNGYVLDATLEHSKAWIPKGVDPESTAVHARCRGSRSVSPEVA